mmetsp:Transcript_29392/g.47353  ORF Transcript_29392/g.47353 Transcript_29392/m.47353 type:complete len:220 (+) Transcript_29392:146-805(+)
MTPGGFNEGWKDYRIDSLGCVLQRVAACCSVTFTNHAKNINHSQDIQLVPFQLFFFFESTCDYTRLTSDAPILVHLHSFVPIHECVGWLVLIHQASCATILPPPRLPSNVGLAGVDLVSAVREGCDVSPHQVAHQPAANATKHGREDFAVDCARSAGEEGSAQACACQPADASEDTGVPEGIEVGARLGIRGSKLGNIRRCPWLEALLGSGRLQEHLLL